MESMDIPDGDLVRLARDGDPAAFRLLVERHLPMARARAARLCPQPGDADDAVQDAFLQAFIALDRLRDPDRFAGWLGGILANVCRAQRRRPPLTLLGDWPENLHPASAHGLPSAENLDRAAALGRDLIPALSGRVPMTAVRIAHADPWPGRRPDGGMSVSQVLVVLADDGGHRALPIRLPGHDGGFWRLLARPEDRDAELPYDHAEEMTGQLLHAAGITVTAVTVTDLGPGVTATRIDIAAPGGTRQMTARLADGLALAVITGTPLAVDDPVMDRLAQPVTGPGLLSPFRSRQQAPRALREHSVRAAQPDVRRRPAPMAARRHLPAPGHRVPRPGLFLHHRRQACDPDRGRARTRRIRLPQPGDQRRRLPRPRRRLPRRPALHRRRRPRRTGAPHHPRRTATSRTGSLARSRQPLRLRHRNPRLGPA